jgi:hypothetical protein
MALWGAILFSLPGLYVSFRGRGVPMLVGLTALSLAWIFAHPHGLFWPSAIAILVSIGVGWSTRSYERPVLAIVGGLYVSALLLTMAYQLGTLLQADPRPVHYRLALPYIVPVLVVLTASLVTLGLKMNDKVLTAVVGAVFAVQGAALVAGGFLIHGAMAGLRWVTDPSILFGWQPDPALLYFVPIYGHGAVPEKPWIAYFAFLIPLAAMGYFIQTRLTPASSDTPELHDVAKGV